MSGLLPHYDDHSYKPTTVEVEEGAIIKPRKGKKSKALGADYQENDTITTKLNSEYGARKDSKKSNSKTSARDLLNFLDETAEDNLTFVKAENEDRDIIQDSLDQLKKKRILDNSIKNIYQNQVVDEEEESYLLKSIERSRKKAENNHTNKFNLLEAIKEEELGQPEQ
jgi:dTDP-D-glucose 4,6-dehydratase